MIKGKEIFSQINNDWGFTSVKQKQQAMKEIN